MRQPDWRLWLLHDRPREMAQVMFLLHPEWEEFASQTEVGFLKLALPCGEETVLLECDDNGATITFGGIEDRLEDREAMRLAETLLSEYRDSRMRG